VTDAADTLAGCCCCCCCCLLGSAAVIILPFERNLAAVYQSVHTLQLTADDESGRVASSSFRLLPSQQTWSATQLNSASPDTTETAAPKPKYPYIRGYFKASFPHFNGTGSVYTFVSVNRRNNEPREKWTRASLFRRFRDTNVCGK